MISEGECEDFSLGNPNRAGIFFSIKDFLGKISLELCVKNKKQVVFKFYLLLNTKIYVSLMMSGSK